MDSYYTSYFISFCIQYNGDIFPNQMNFYAKMIFNHPRETYQVFMKAVIKH